MRIYIAGNIFEAAAERHIAYQLINDDPRLEPLVKVMVDPSDHSQRFVDARPASQLIAQCDVFLLILKSEYGGLITADDRSLLHIEIDRGRSHRKRGLILKDPEHDPEDGIKRLLRGFNFRGQVHSYQSIDDFQQRLQATLDHILDPEMIDDVSFMLKPTRVFVCHASRDKYRIENDILKEFDERGIDYDYDRYTFEHGTHDMKAYIRDLIRRSGHVLMLFSRNTERLFGDAPTMKTEIEDAFRIQDLLGETFIKIAKIEECTLPRTVQRHCDGTPLYFQFFGPQYRENIQRFFAEIK